MTLPLCGGETGIWLSGRKVLISLVAFVKPELDSRTISANLTCARVHSPDVDKERSTERETVSLAD